jgi:ribosomal protein S18 acetylase RimI-like enzyme
MEISYFGIFKEFFGKGIGGYLLTDAILTSFNQRINKVWVHTCTLDHANALKNYLARGMKIFKTEKIFYNPENL